ncbi:proton-coupled folate transporter-like [Dendronephthya gigantea]|uniref:proton-coupled folate transporter-like n=1 Tax=Dendronephthya gigantea TaxID=151771 RepID=UPI00106C35B1|nr:proton-coupled folate transporter-like [Dendronephthya gigantea]
MGFLQIFRQITVEPVLFAFMLCTFLKMPVSQQLIFRKTCISLYNESFCEHNFTSRSCGESLSDEEIAVQKSSSQWIFYNTLAYELPSIVTSLLLGSWSDKFGRKFAILLPLVGLGLEAISGLVNAHFFSASPVYLLFGNILSGMFGGFSTILMALFSYIADITKDKRERTLRIGLLESMTFFGGATGELISGVLIEKLGFIAPYIVILSLVVITTIYVVLVLKESYFPNQQSRFFSTESFLGSLKVWVKNRPGKRRLQLILLLLIGFFAPFIVLTGTNDVIILFLLRRPFCFSSPMIGYFLAVSLGVRCFGVLFGMPILIRMFKLSDTTIVCAGIITNIASTVFIAFTTKTWQAFLAISSGIFNGVIIPTVRAMMSKLVDSDEQGSLFAVIASASAISTLIASLIFNNIYKLTVSTLPGLCFLLMAGLLIFPLFLMIYLRISDKSPSLVLEVNNDDALIDSEESTT